MRYFTLTLKFVSYFSQDCGTNRDVVPKQRYDRFPSVGDHIHAAATFVRAWANPGHTAIGGS